ncbi:hypothetical protein AKO1_014653 [Acrasis kona]|uniref:Uncharacterized protein n=1 Tax=Acrasis kona TaxID=1008807 RepID=A0AAW2Z2Y6_9EUKA
MGNKCSVELQNLTAYDIQLYDRKIIKGQATNICTDTIKPKMTKALSLFECNKKPVPSPWDPGYNCLQEYHFVGTFYYQMIPTSTVNIINKIFFFEIKCMVHQENPSKNVFKLMPMVTRSDGEAHDFPFSFLEPSPEDAFTNHCIFEISDPLREEQDLIISRASSLKSDNQETSGE